jgi:hypothetical protein
MNINTGAFVPMSGTKRRRNMDAKIRRRRSEFKKRVKVAAIDEAAKIVASGESAADKVSPNVAYNVFRAIMPEKTAKALAGYSPGSGALPAKKFEGTVADIRERIQNDERFGFLRQLDFYADMRDDEEVEAKDRISAAKQLDTVSGYNAPQKLEMTERKSLVAAVRVLHQVTGDAGISPLQLKRMLDAQSLGGGAGEIVEGVMIEHETQTQERNNEPQ